MEEIQASIQFRFSEIKLSHKKKGRKVKREIILPNGLNSSFIINPFQFN